MIRKLIVMVSISIPCFAQTDTIRISMKAAMLASQKSSANAQIAESRVRESQARIDEAKAALLPSFGALASDMSRSYNYAAQVPPSMLENMRLRDNKVELDHVQDARLNARISLFNYASWKRLTLSKESAHLSTKESASTNDVAAFQAGDAWLNLARAQALIRSQQNRLQIAMQIDSITDQQITAGTATQFDQIRSQGLIVAAQSSLDLSQSQEELAQINLQKILGLSMRQSLKTADTLAEPSFQLMANTDSLVTFAIANRPEVQAAQQRIQVAEFEKNAISAEAYPTVDFSADYGISAYQLDNSELVNTIMVQATWSIWDAGRRKARKVQQNEKLTQARIQLTDLKATVEQEVRSALSQMQSAKRLLAITKQRSELSHRELELAQERFVAGASGLLDVINSQNNLSMVDDAMIDALYRYNQAYLCLLKATHQLETL